MLLSSLGNQFLACLSYLLFQDPGMGPGLKLTGLESESGFPQEAAWVLWKMTNHVSGFFQEAV
jgi:hypothetical protein